MKVESRPLVPLLTCMVSGLKPALLGASLSGFISPRQIPDKHCLEEAGDS